MCNDKIYSWDSDKPSGNLRFDKWMKKQVDTLHAEILESGVVTIIENDDSNIAFEDLPIILLEGLEG